MGPRKRGRIPFRVDSSLSEDAAKLPAEEPPVPTIPSKPQSEDKSSGWTDEQETSLFKAMIRWKPVGMHKHFRMIAISDNLRNHGYNGYAAPQNSHVTIPGIWEKLGSLYNLDVLDLREDHISDSTQEIDGSFYEFKLPDEDFRQMTFARRLAPEGSSSPPSLPYQLSSVAYEGGRATRRYSTVDDTDEPRSSPASTHGTPSGRNTRASRGTRGSRLAEVSTPGEKNVAKNSVDQGGEEEEKEDQEEDDNDNDDDDAMEIEEENDKAEAPKRRGRASKGSAGKNSTRKSGRKR